MRFIFIIIILLMISSCSDSITPVSPEDPIIDDPPRPADTLYSINNDEALIPLTTGNYWKYFWFEYDRWGEDTVFTGQFKWEVHEPVLLQDSIDYYYSYPMSSSFPELWEPNDYQWLYFNSEDGLCNFGGISSTDTLAENVLLFKYPTVTGEKWQSIRLQYDIIDSLFINDEQMTVTCVATDSIISTPIGEFSCYVYNYQVIQEPDVLERLDIYKFIAPGIGEIGQVIRSTSDGDRKFAHIIYEYNLE